MLLLLLLLLLLQEMLQCGLPLLRLAAAASASAAASAERGEVAEEGARRGRRPADGLLTAGLTEIGTEHCAGTLARHVTKNNNR